MNGNLAWISTGNEFTLLPNFQEHYEHRLAEEEREKLERKVSSLSEEQRAHIYQQGRQLLEDQEKQEGADCLPTLLVSGS